MGAGSSVDVSSLEHAMPHDNKPMDLSEASRIFGPQVANMKLFDALKDENGKISPKEFKVMVTQVKRINEERRAAAIVANEGVGGKAKEKLVQELQMKEQELKQLEQEKIAFQKTLQETSEIASNRPSSVSANAIRENAQKLAELEARQAALAAETKAQNQAILNVRKQEVAKRNADRVARGDEILKSTVGKTGYAFTPKGGGGGGGGGRTPNMVSYLADPGAQHKHGHISKTMSTQFAEYEARQSRRIRRYSDEEIKPKWDESPKNGGY